MAVAAPASEVSDPSFIRYLLDPKLEHDCYFMVGNRELTVPIKIGAVKKMLLAHSLVFRNELQDSKLAEKGVVPITDLYPDTFKNLLRYVYGFDTTASLRFNDADDLFYAADKYLMATLKDKLASRLMSLLTYENICGLMNNPACYQHLALNTAITEILQGKTGKVFASPQFPDLTSDAFLKILEQNVMSVPEIEVWRAALKWAKHKAGCEDGDVLRQKLKPHFKQIRLCTLNVEDLYQEVAQAQVINDAEMVLISQSVVLKKKQDKLTEICNTTIGRTITNSMIDTSSSCRSVEKSGPLQVDFRFSEPTYCSKAGFKLLIRKFGIELLPFVFIAKKPPSSMTPESATYQCEGSVVISRITDYNTNTSAEDSIIIMINEKVRFGTKFQVPITLGGDNLQLLPDNLYSIEVKFNMAHEMYLSQSNSSFPHEHFKIQCTAESCILYSHYYYYYPINKLMYKTLTYKTACVDC